MEGRDPEGGEERKGLLIFAGSQGWMGCRGGGAQQREQAMK